ncbi:MAG: multidrug ABC transporter ATP-binding protein, partial [Nitrospirae bacterium CG17_big_fil_post_rev_8_21_14_2_50_50_9]
TLPGVQRVSIYGDRLHITLESREVLGRVLEEMKQNQIGIKGSREIVPSLEDIFISMVESQ